VVHQCHSSERTKLSATRPVDWMSEGGSMDQLYDQI
jgi:hypothetical protein